MRRKWNKKKLWQSLAAGFGTMYLVTMGLSTFLVKEKFVEEDRKRLEQVAAAVFDRAGEKEFAMEGQDWGRKERQDFYQGLVNDFFWMTDNESMLISMACYDQDKKLLAQSRDEIGGNAIYEGETRMREYEAYGLDEFLLPEEKGELASYLWENQELARHWDHMLPEPYRFSVLVSPEDQALWGIYVQEITWRERREGEENPYYPDPLTGSRYSMETGCVVDYETGEEQGRIQCYDETDSQVVWSWVNPDISPAQLQRGVVRNTKLNLPYMNAVQSWQRWNASEYLHGFSDEGEFSWEEGREYPLLQVDGDGFYFRSRYSLQMGMAGEPFAYLEIRMESRPWLDAMKDMKYLYLAGFVLTLACMGKLLFVFRKIYAQQAALEETRRDITNAMAHELKTPLGIIRNFAENLMERSMEEKRDYYLAQIIRQTEEMDDLVAEMIQLSRLDSREEIRKREHVSVLELIQEQLTKFAPLIQEKNLQVEIQDQGPFLVYGDREYLGKAVWNLLSNAVDYNVPGGKIRIQVDEKSCSVENTGKRMEEDQLLHAFDLFYTGDKSRNKKERHMGLGLFLARKILGLHELELRLENVEDGVRAVMDSRFSNRRDCSKIKKNNSGSRRKAL